MKIRRGLVTPLKAACVVMYCRLGMSYRQISDLRLENIKMREFGITIEGDDGAKFTARGIDATVIANFLQNPGHGHQYFLANEERRITVKNITFYLEQLIGTGKRVYVADNKMHDIYNDLLVLQNNAKKKDEALAEPVVSTQPVVKQQPEVNKLPIYDLIALAELLTTQMPADRNKLISRATRGAGTQLTNLLEALESNDVATRTAARVALVFGVGDTIMNSDNTGLPFAESYINGWDNAKGQQYLIQSMGIDSICSQIESYLETRYSGSKKVSQVEWERAFKIIAKLRKRSLEHRNTIVELNNLLSVADKELQEQKTFQNTVEERLRKYEGLGEELTELKTRYEEAIREKNVLIEQYNLLQSITSEEEDPSEVVAIQPVFQDQQIAVIGGEQKKTMYTEALEKLGARVIFANSWSTSDTVNIAKNTDGALLMIRLLGHGPYRSSLETLRQSGTPYEIVHSQGVKALQAAAIKLASKMSNTATA